MKKGDREAVTLGKPQAPPGARLDWGRKGFAGWQRDVATAFVEAVLADEDEQGELVPGDATTCAVATRALDDAIGCSSADLRRGFFVLSVLMEWLPIAVIFAPGRMSRLPLARRIAYLTALESSRFGLLAMLFVAFKVPLCIPAFEEAEELASTGFDRPDTTARRRLPSAPRDAVRDAVRDQMPAEIGAEA